MTQYEYNANGDQTKTITANGKTIVSTYDSANRLVSTWINGMIAYSYSYDANGNIISVNDGTGMVENNSYDVKDQVTQQTVRGNTINYTYDANGKTTLLKTTVGSVSHSNAFTYDEDEQLTKLSIDGANSALYSYDNRGNVATIGLANGMSSTMQYNAANQLSSYQNKKADNSILNSFDYTFDSNGNITQIKTSKGNITYAYDSLNQLTKETLENVNIYNYKYDAVGNRLSKERITSSGTTVNNYTYNAANELVSVNGQSYVYDKNGNLVDDGIDLYEWDANNNLISIKAKSSGAKIADYKYDQNNRRIQKTVNNAVTNYTYDDDSNHVLFETDGTGKPIHSYAYDAKDQLVSMTDQQGAVYYYLLNGHGDVTGLTDSSGNIVAQYEYDSWGNLISKSGAMAEANPYRYAGYRYDNETGLYYLMARYYNADIGNFLSKDSDGGDKDKPLTENGYSYANNNPVINIDPEGDFPLALVEIYFVPGVGEVALATTGIVFLFATSGYASYRLATYIKAKLSEREGPVGKSGRKKQGREVNKKNRLKDNYKSRSNKNPNRPTKKHTSGRGHKKGKK